MCSSASPLLAMCRRAWARDILGTPSAPATAPPSKADPYSTRCSVVRCHRSPPSAVGKLAAGRLVGSFAAGAADATADSGGRSAGGSLEGSSSPATRRVTRCIAIANSSCVSVPSASTSERCQTRSSSLFGRLERRKKVAAASAETRLVSPARRMVRNTPA